MASLRLALTANLHILQDIDDLASFLNAYKTLKRKYAALVTENNEVQNLRTQLSQSQSSEREALSVAQRAQTELDTMITHTASLEKQLEETSESEEKATKNMVAMRYTLGLQEVKTASANVSLREAEKKAQDLAAEVEALRLAKETVEQQLKDTASSEAIKRELHAVQAKNEGLLEESVMLQNRVKTLEEEVKDTKDRFNAYQAKIRAVTM